MEKKTVDRIWQVLIGLAAIALVASILWPKKANSQTTSQGVINVPQTTAVAHFCSFDNLAIIQRAKGEPEDKARALVKDIARREYGFNERTFHGLWAVVEGSIKYAYSLGVDTAKNRIDSAKTGLCEALLDPTKDGKDVFVPKVMAKTPMLAAKAGNGDPKLK
ncbi:MAG: hypothetical protein AAB507_01430 [Patescibacteria group bacterium]